MSKRRVTTYSTQNLKKFTPLIIESQKIRLRRTTVSGGQDVKTGLKKRDFNNQTSGTEPGEGDKSREGPVPGSYGMRTQEPTSQTRTPVKSSRGYLKPVPRLGSRWTLHVYNTIPSIQMWITIHILVDSNIPRSRNANRSNLYRTLKVEGLKNPFRRSPDFLRTVKCRKCH